MRNGLLTGGALALLVLFLTGCTANGGFPGVGTDNQGGGGAIGGGDGDGDGVADSNDLCPGTAPGAVVNDNGCSEEQFGGTLPVGAKCSGHTRGTATAGSADGNLCGAGVALDPILDGLLGTQSCFVTEAQNAADGDRDSFATMTYTAALLDPDSLGFSAGDPIDGNLNITVSGLGSRPPGSIAAFDLEVPGSTLNLGILESIQVRTLQDSTVVEAFESAQGASLDGSGLLFVDLMSTMGNNERFAAGFIASQPYNAIQILASASLLGIDIGVDESERSLFVYDVCTDAVISE